MSRLAAIARIVLALSVLLALVGLRAPGECGQTSSAAALLLKARCCCPASAHVRPPPGQDSIAGPRCCATGEPCVTSSPTPPAGPLGNAVAQTDAPPAAAPVVLELPPPPRPPSTSGWTPHAAPPEVGPPLILQKSSLLI